MGMLIYAKLVIVFTKNQSFPLIPKSFFFCSLFRLD